MSLHLIDRSGKVFAECRTDADADKILGWQKVSDYFSRPRGLSVELDAAIRAGDCELLEWYCFIETNKAGYVQSVWHRAIARDSSGGTVFASWHKGNPSFIAAESDRVVYPKKPPRDAKKFRRFRAKGR